MGWTLGSRPLMSIFSFLYARKLQDGVTFVSPPNLKGRREDFGTALGFRGTNNVIVDWGEESSRRAREGAVIPRA